MPGMISNTVGDMPYNVMRMEDFPRTFREFVQKFPDVSGAADVTFGYDWSKKGRRS